MAPASITDSNLTSWRVRPRSGEKESEALVNSPHLINPKRPSHMRCTIINPNMVKNRPLARVLQISLRTEVVIGSLVDIPFLATFFIPFKVSLNRLIGRD